MSAQRLPTPGSDINTWGAILNGFLEVSHNPDGSLTSAAVSTGGAEITAHKGQAGGYAPLDSNALVPTINLPSGASTPAATTSTQGIIQLAGDLAGTAGSPTVPALASKVSSVAATDATITVGGTSTAPTIGVNAIPESKVTSLTADLAATEKTANKGNASGYASLNSSGLVPTTQLGTGSASSSNYLRGDGSWSTPAGGVTLDSTASDIQPDTVTGSPVAGSTGKAADAGHQHTLVSHTHGSANQGGNIPEASVTNLTADLAATEKTTNKGAVSGYAPLNGSSQVPIANIPTGTISTTVAIGNDSRFAGSAAGTVGAALAATDSSTTNSRTPTGAAGGDLGSTYPNPTVVQTHLSAALPVNQGGTGAATLTGLVIGNGTSAMTTITAPAGTVVGTSDTQTLSNKRQTRRVVSVSQSATPTVNTNNTDVASITGLAQDITSMTTNLSGTPVDGDSLIIRFTDNGTARAITWGSSFESSTISLPTTTVISTMLVVGFIWNTVTSKWRCVGSA